MQKKEVIKVLAENGVDFICFGIPLDVKVTLSNEPFLFEHVVLKQEDISFLKKDLRKQFGSLERNYILL